MTAEIMVSRVSWDDYAADLTDVRTKVFVDGMGISQALEQDGHDASYQHVLATAKSNDETTAVGAGRMSPDGKIGRMAVLSEWRNCGIGGRMLVELIQTARDNNLSRVYLSAQHTAIKFYLAHGFQTEGKPYEEAGIIHQKMTVDFA